MGNTAEVQAKYDELKGFIAETMKKPGPLMPIMQKAQDIFGSLPFDVQRFISEEMGIPMSDIYGVATFYSQFALEPKGKHVIGVCMGTACYVKKAESILNALGDELQTAPGGTTPRCAVYTGSDALPWVLRACSRHDDRRSGIRQAESGGYPRDNQPV